MAIKLAEGWDYAINTLESPLKRGGPESHEEPSIFDKMTESQRRMFGTEQAETLRRVTRPMRLTPHGFLIAA